MSISNCTDLDRQKERLLSHIINRYNILEKDTTYTRINLELKSDSIENITLSSDSLEWSTIYNGNIYNFQGLSSFFFPILYNFLNSYSSTDNTQYHAIDSIQFSKPYIKFEIDRAMVNPDSIEKYLQEAFNIEISRSDSVDGYHTYYDCSEMSYLKSTEDYTLEDERLMIVIKSKYNTRGRIVILNSNNKILYKSKIESFPIRVNKEILEETNVMSLTTSN